MRKINKKAVMAFNAGYAYKNNNTKVECDKSGVYMYLHNNMIAKKFYGGGTYLNHCGWKTATTKSRLNGILSLYHWDGHIYQKNFNWYWKNGEEFKSGWNEV